MNIKHSFQRYGCKIFVCGRPHNIRQPHPLSFLPGFSISHITNGNEPPPDPPSYSPKKKVGLSRDENARRDGSRRRNPARYADQYTKNHNAQYPNNPGRQMLEFEDKDDDRARNERAYRIVDTTLRRMLQGMDVYIYI